MTVLQYDVDAWGEISVWTWQFSAMFGPLIKDNRFKGKDLI